MKLDLTVQEANLVLAALARLPYEAVFELIEKIKSQAEEKKDK